MMPRLPPGAGSKLWGKPTIPCPVCNHCGFPICGPARRATSGYWFHYDRAVCDKISRLADLDIMDAMEHDMGIP